MLAHAFLAVTAHAVRPGPVPPAGADDSQLAENGSLSLWTNIQPAQDI